ncbi:MAG TPA: TIGR03619 family F420-dependent LLM class oxidoreductase [Acidimicrobiales bacterium]|nr:TIGR03619 family F420-dependent LLM class oxidoreductase [Acidimicrobiales bacterium]
MKFGITLGVLNPAVWADVTVEADRLGFESLWVPEHLVLPIEMAGSPFAESEHPPIPPTVPVFDAFSYLAYLAALTQRIRLGTYVYNIGLRHPFSTARAAATVDIVSKGRLILGIGASWLRSEWEAVGLDFDSRGARVDEAIDVCRRLWTEEVVEHHGRFFDFGPVAFEPKPVQKPGLALHVGGDGPAAIRRAARVGDGWLPMNYSATNLAGVMPQLREQCRRYEREQLPEVTVSGQVASGADVEAAAEAGADRLIVRPWRRSAEAADGMRRFRDEFAAYFEEPAF